MIETTVVYKAIVHEKIIYSQSYCWFGMVSFIELKGAKQSSLELVGKKALLLAHLDGVIKLPFSLVLTSEVFGRFVEHNRIGNRITELFVNNKLVEEDVYAFKQVSELIGKGTFPPSLAQELQECFELVSLDTTNLESLGDKPRHILSLRRSLDYVDDDIISPQTVYVRNSFGDFLKAIKTVFVSAFAPSSVASRRKNKVVDFSLGVVVSRLPNVQKTLESHYNYYHNAIDVQSYIGFIDPSKTVPRDRFTIGVDFLRVLRADIKPQELVAVFDAHQNLIRQQKFHPEGSSQSVTDTLVLEAGRQMKKMVNALQAKELAALFVVDDKEILTCLDVHYLGQSKEFSPSQFSHDSIPKPASENHLDTLPSLPTGAGLDVQLHDEYNTEATKKFATDLISFLNAHKRGKFGPSIDVVVRALENEATPESVHQGLLMAKEVIEDWD